MADPAIAVDKVSYEGLYERWEQGNWRSTELDFTTDREHWHERFGELERRAARWHYSMFMHGEHAVAEGLTPYIDAAPEAEHKYFLATQQADEARHSVFFARFLREVVELGGGDVGSALAATGADVTWGFRKLLERLERMGAELRRDRSRPKLAQAVVLYHVVIEGTCGQPVQHFIQDYLAEREVLPAFSAGMRNVALDEQRHIAFGVKLLADLIRADPECRDAIAELLPGLRPWTMAVFVPPGFDRRLVECFGWTLERIYAGATESFETKMEAIGMPLRELPRNPFPADMPAAERAGRMLTLLESGLLGEKVGPPARDHGALAVHFEAVASSLDRATAATEKMTIQWDLADAEPWHVVVDNGSSAARHGRAERPDVTLSCTLEQWVDIANRREDPRLALLRRRLRVHGSPSALWRTRKLLAP